MSRIMIFGILLGLLMIPGSSGYAQERQTATLLWSDDFEDGNADGWQIHDDVSGEHSNWYVEGGYFIQTSNIGSNSVGTHAVAGSPGWDNYTLSANVISTDDDYIGVLFRYQDPENYYRFSLSSQSGRIRLDKRVNGSMQAIGVITMAWPLCTFNIIVDVQQDTIAVYLNHERYFQITDNSFTQGQVGFSCVNNNGSFFDDISVYDRLAVDPPDPGLVINRGPYLQSVLGDSAVVMWRTNQYTNSIVEYGLSMTETQLAGVTTPVRNHEIVLRDLIPGADYVYRIFSGDQESDWSSFSAACLPEDPFSFAVLGDNRTNFLRHEQISAALANETPDFLINVGDVVQYGLRRDWDTEFFNPMADLIRTMPIYVSIGNHEKESPYFNEYFAFPDPEHEHYYAFQYGNAYFIFLDNSIAAYPTSNYPAIDEESPQYQWLEEQLSSSAAQDAEWLFVMAHVPIYSVGTNNNYELNRTYLLPLMLDYHVDIYFAGHIHDYERGYSEGLYHIISGGAGGPLSHRVRVLPEIPRQVSDYHFCMIDINDSVLSVRVKNRDEDVLDQFVITKDPDGNITNGPVVPRQLTVSNYPNPFNASTMIKFSLPEESDYSIRIFDLAGRLVKTLVENSAPAGTYWLHWDGDDVNGLQVPSGIYTCQVVTAAGSSQVKITYLK